MQLLVPHPLPDPSLHPLHRILTPQYLKGNLETEAI